MDMRTLMMMVLLGEGRRPSMAIRIAGMVFVLLCAIGILIAGIVTGNGVLLFFGILWTVSFAIITAILILYNIRKNTPRW